MCYMVTKATVSHFRCAPSNPGGAARAGPPGVEEDLIASRAAQVGSVLDQDRVATARPTPGCLRTGTTGSPAPGQSRRGCRGLLRRTRSPPGGPRSPSTEKRREKKDPRRRKLLRRRGEVPALYDRGRGPKSFHAAAASLATITTPSTATGEASARRANSKPSRPP